MRPLVRLAGRLSCSDQGGLGVSGEERGWQSEAQATQLQASPLETPD